MKKIERCSFMSEYCIISDGSCDLPKDLAARENITVVPFYVSFDEKLYEGRRGYWCARFLSENGR